MLAANDQVQALEGGIESTSRVSNHHRPFRIVYSILIIERARV